MLWTGYPGLPVCRIHIPLFWREVTVNLLREERRCHRPFQTCCGHRTRKPRKPEASMMLNPGQMRIKVALWVSGNHKCWETCRNIRIWHRYVWGARQLPRVWKLGQSTSRIRSSRWWHYGPTFGLQLHVSTSHYYQVCCSGGKPRQGHQSSEALDRHRMKSIASSKDRFENILGLELSVRF